jgi:hypothetical protein
LSAPDIDRFELTRDGHRGEHSSSHVKRALEAHEGAEMGDTAGQLRTVEKHRKRPLNGAAALGDGVHDRVVLCRNLFLARDRLQSWHLRFLSLGLPSGEDMIQMRQQERRSGRWPT